MSGFIWSNLLEVADLSKESDCMPVMVDLDVYADD